MSPGQGDLPVGENPCHEGMGATKPKRRQPRVQVWEKDGLTPLKALCWPCRHYKHGSGPVLNFSHRLLLTMDINTAIILMRKLRLREIKALTRVTWWMMVGFYALPHFSDQKTLLSITTFHLCLHHLQWCLSLIFTSDILFFHPSISVLPSSYNFRPAECGVEAGKFLPPHLHTYFTFWHTSSFKSSSAPSKNISMSGPATEYGLRLQH